MKAIKRILIPSMICILAACVNLPAGPSVMTLPGSGKSFEQFRYDEHECRQYAYEQVGGTTPRQSSQMSGIESAAIGGGSGAAIGAGTGLLAGGVVGSGTASTSAYANQQRYDISYIQCMYAKGHRVPISGRITNDPPVNNTNRGISAPPPARFNPPPPPPAPPPPPPR